MSDPSGTIPVMRIAVAPGPDGTAWLSTVDGQPRFVADLAAEVRAAHPDTRWIWPDTAACYPALLAAGARVARCHDLALIEGLLSGHDGHWGEPRSLAAAVARLDGRPVPADPEPVTHDPRLQPALFDHAPPAERSTMDDVLRVHAAQQKRIAEIGDRGAFATLCALESAGALIAAEMSHTGLPWRADVHRALLAELMGTPLAPGMPPRRLTELAAEISAAFGGRPIHPDLPAEVIKAFAAAGIRLPSTRSWVLKEIDHPAVKPLLAYKELYRIHTAHGQAWLDTWVHNGRFRAEYVVGGVVSGRWATRGGAALQIPRVIRRAVVADPDWVLVVADAGQLEPRILAALSGDRRLGEVAAAGDLYAALAAEAFDGDRDRAKLGLLGVLYGQTSGQAGQLLPVLRQRFPAAIDYVERAAVAGEQGLLVRSGLGRTCPSPSASWWSQTGVDPGAVSVTRDGAGAARSRGRFTRNFVVQASAAEWALVVLAELRRALHEGGLGELVFFQHDEFIVHCPAAQADAVTAAVHAAAERAGDLLYPGVPVRFPMSVATSASYADAK
ncbi:bifunctional 3'-5' exonuclease/DNA polymerase [Pseudonocardiaceae bacterium YIM PH 21723]|nr:bifunctional 3'-5' exonuclease/DNA polymerase [Pseudonocardiaceae bacterium YIM PH 21723]